MPIDLPNVSLQIIPAQQLAGVVEQRVLIPGQKLVAGSAPSGELIQDFPNDGSEDTLFGRRSHLAGLVRKFKEINKVSKLDIIPLSDNGTAIKGEGTITFVGTTSSAEGTITVTVISDIDYSIERTFESGAAIADIAATVAALFNNIDYRPFSGSSLAGVTTFTAENGGELSNDWGIKVEGEIPGITITVGAFSGGANNPAPGDILDPVANIRYQTILWPSSYDNNELITKLNARFNVANAIMDGVGIQAQVDTLANLKTFVEDFNSQSIVVPGQKKVNKAKNKGPATMEMADIACAQICAIRALRLTQGALLTQYLTTVAPSDQFGGIGIASLPYFNTAIPNIGVAKAVDEFSPTDLAELTNNGIAMYGPNKAYNGTIFGEFVTTYLTDTAGNPDDSFKFLNTVDTASVIREFYFTNLKARYAQTRLTDGDLVAGRDIANASSIRAFCNQLYDELAEEALVQRGTAAKKDYNQNLVVTVDVREGKATIDQAPLLVSQLRVILGTIQINFGG
jgi:phage tail sheath gpL-like